MTHRTMGEGTRLLGRPAATITTQKARFTFVLGLAMLQWTGLVDVVSQKVAMNRVVPVLAMKGGHPLS